MNYVEQITTLPKEESIKSIIDALNSKAFDTLAEGVRKVGEYEAGRHKAVIHKDSDLGEFKVKFHTDGKHLSDADYHADDLADAKGTAKSQVDTLHAKD